MKSHVMQNAVKSPAKDLGSCEGPEKEKEEMPWEEPWDGQWECQETGGGLNEMGKGKGKGKSKGKGKGLCWGCGSVTR